ncbi:MAG: CPBP family intramembrane metalloprotease [Myxococcota bacterium]|nr:CPBP family intramembrane metalloprotease [Myxococcota bacterium]
MRPTRFLLRCFALASGLALLVIGSQWVLAVLPLSPSDLLATDALTSAAALAFVALAVASFGDERVSARLGLGPGRFGAARIAIATLGLVALSHAAESLVTLSGVASPGLARFDAALAGLGFREAWFPLLALSIGSACGEELFFRGLVQRGLAPRTGSVVAIAATALLFGVAHAVNNGAALIEKLAEFHLPTGPATLAAGLTLACVALWMLAREPLQSSPRPSD